MSSKIRWGKSARTLQTAVPQAIAKRERKRTRRKQKGKKKGKTIRLETDGRSMPSSTSRRTVLYTCALCLFLYSNGDLGVAGDGNRIEKIVSIKGRLKKDENESVRVPRGSSVVLFERMRHEVENKGEMKRRGQ